MLVQSETETVVIDCGPDFRQQMLRAFVNSIDAIVFTHEHNDHIIGLDDVRPFNFKYGKEMQAFASEQVQVALRKRFDYVFAEERYPGAPMVNVTTIDKDNSFQIGSLEFHPIEAMHGRLPVLGFRIKNFVYLTDVKTIREEELKKLSGVEILVLNALHQDHHYTHLNLSEALDLIQFLEPKQAYLTHISHRMGKHAEVSRILPENVSIAYDGLNFTVG